MSIDNNMSEILDIEPESCNTSVVVIPDTQDATPEVELALVESDDTVVKIDTSFARKNIKSLIMKGNTAIDQLLTIAAASQHPRAYEVAANLLKTLAEMNKDLLVLQRHKKELLPPTGNTAPATYVDKAIFVGTTEEMHALLRNKSRKDE